MINMTCRLSPNHPKTSLGSLGCEGGLIQLIKTVRKVEWPIGFDTAFRRCTAAAAWCICSAFRRRCGGSACVL